MTILYESKKSFHILLSTRGTVWGRVLPLAIIAVAITVGVYELREADIDLTFPVTGHKMLSIMVAYLTVIRVNVAYNRFWEARTILAKTLQSARQLSIHVAAFTSGDTMSDGAIMWRAMLRQHMTHLVHSTLYMIRHQEVTYDFVGVPKQNDGGASDGGETVDESYEERLNRRFQSIPALSYAIHKDIVMNKKFLEKPLSVLHENRLHQFMLDYEQMLYELCKFQATPYPFPTSQMTRIVLFVWVFTLPLALSSGVEEPYSTPVLMFFITVGFFGLEYISIELDDPFGDDLNDLDTEEFTIVSSVNLY